MGFFIFGKAHTGSLYGFLPSADIGQVVYWGVWPNTQRGAEARRNALSRHGIVLEQSFEKTQTQTRLQFICVPGTRGNQRKGQKLTGSCQRLL
jgi:hypothetical protein